MDFYVRKDVKDYWLAALKAGTHKQGKLLLRTNEDQYCFLGVLADLSVTYGGVVRTQDKVSYVYDGYRECLPDKAIEWAGMKNGNGFTTHVGQSLTKLNDESMPWNDLIMLLEKNWESL